MITQRQIRAARALIGWDAADLAAKAGLTRATVSNIENGVVQPREDTMNRIARVFDENGVEFTDHQGVRFKPEDIKILEGRNGLITLMEDIYESCRRGIAGDVVLAGAPEEEFQRILGEYDDIYLANMSSIPNFKMRTLICEADFNTVSSKYTEYRWMPRDQFQAVPFYAYAEKLAIIVFQSEPSPRIFIIQSKTISDAYRRQFESMWIHASQPIN